MKLKISDLSKNYGEVQALSHVSIELENGIYGLLGPNGAGKSTLINLITDNVRRDTGQILWDGKDILDLGKNYRNILGYMPQQQGYYEDFSAGAFLMYMARLKGLSKKEAEKKTLELLEVVNLKEYRKEKIGAFSGGMKQRLLIAQALLNNPQLLILDEPTAGVDPQERIRIRNFISEIATNRIVILATHIVPDVESIAKEIILMKKGEIIGRGTPYKLLEDIKSNVYEIPIKQSELGTIQNKYIVSNLRHISNGLAVRVVADNPPEGYTYERVMPNLEDVYLYYFNELEN
ncbi:MAG: ABC transporter ATP-binding protein [Eubacterium sp.]